MVITSNAFFGELGLTCASETATDKQLGFRRTSSIPYLSGFRPAKIHYNIDKFDCASQAR